MKRSVFCRCAVSRTGLPNTFIIRRRVAAARRALVEAGAARRDLDPCALATEEGEVLHPADLRIIATERGHRPPPAPLKPGKSAR